MQKLMINNTFRYIGIFAIEKPSLDNAFRLIAITL